jgi:crossover junction endodeoxyribonuclease RusA
MISFFVPGTPKPQGSKRGFVNKHTGKVAMVESAGAPLKDWRGDVKRFAVDAMGELLPLTGPVGLVLEFRLQRPKSHPKSKITYPEKRPDADKLARSVLDALTSVCFVDDAQITQLVVSKQWATETPGVAVRVWDLALEAWSVEAALRQDA